MVGAGAAGQKPINSVIKKVRTRKSLEFNGIGEQF